MSAYLALKERKIVYSDIRTLLGIQNLQLDLTDIAVLVSAVYTVKMQCFCNDPWEQDFHISVVTHIIQEYPKISSK